MFRPLLKSLSASALVAGLVGCSGSAGTADSPRGPGDLLRVGEKAPEFVAKTEKGEEVRLSQFKGKSNVVLVFYPGNNTPVCTSQLCAIRDEWTAFRKKNVAVFGVNHAEADSHGKFREKHKFPFPLLVDESRKLIRDYGCEGTIFAVSRTVYGIDRDGVVVFAERGNPAPEEILAAFPDMPAEPVGSTPAAATAAGS